MVLEVAYRVGLNVLRAYTQLQCEVMGAEGKKRGREGGREARKDKIKE